MPAASVMGSSFLSPLSEAPPLLRLAEPLSMAVNGWLAAFVGPGASADMRFTASMPRHASRLELDISSLVGPGFFLWTLQLLLPFMLRALVQDKEQRLRVM